MLPAMHRLALVAVAASIAALGACGASVSSSSSTDAGSETVDQACGDDAHAMCGRMQACTPASLQTSYGDEGTCEARVKAQCVAAHGAPSSGRTVALTEGCAQAYPGYACADYRDKTNIPASCQQVTGAVASGAACEFAAQCMTGYYAILPGSACGACANAPKDGDSCAAITSCGSTLVCTSDTLVCTTYAAAGQACGIGKSCGAGLSCVAPGGTGTAGTCQAAGAQLGAACDGTAKTAPNCDFAIGLYCNGKKQCATTTYAAAGMPCGYDALSGTLVECTAGACEGADANQHVLGRCAARASDDGACTIGDGGASTANKGCIPSSRCVVSSGATGTCHAVASDSCQ